MSKPTVIGVPQPGGSITEVTTSNPLPVDMQGTVTVDEITITDVATEAKQDVAITHLSTLATNSASAATSANQTTQITSLQLLDDVVHSLNDALAKAVAIAGQMNDSAPTAATEGNVAPVRITPQRALHANLRNDAGTELFTTSNPGNVQGPVSTGSTAPTKPHLIGAIVQNNSPTATYAVGQLAALTADNFGRLVARLFSRGNSSPIVTTITSSTSETTIASASAAPGWRDIIYLIITNTSASATTITIKDSTAGTTRISTRINANEVLYFYFGPTELRQATSNNNWTLTCGTSVASIIVSLYQELINDT